ncbi:MAG: hypothetical protein COT71_03080 [Candidatus Andersenbacteria bacterium CG10_big_fil_rev_8_21_14_0_10_54_11]|uniref:DUF5667 domain-containing protein n=1 Tax=Candidatus Andersenbacteria bacterium CG10_big_fil_rev_8_21_14_0_10_54_11 TaxID=1974485 RepID=A0A2M6WYZ3_9BACT|nr:MAG: hypothetical protein COT71_03080 [Candidatus Andersenbacteria bacterium CG10_big_fil_rev_8_21_14_0_10_54_11]
MSKFLLFLIVAALGGLIYFDILEVNVHVPESGGNLAGTANTILRDKATLEKGRTYITDLKRKGELIFIRDKEKRLVLSLLYVKNDAARLKELIADKTSPEGLLPQAELLVNSLNRVRNTAEKAPVEVVASLKDESAAAFATAAEALGNLKEQSAEYEAIREEFNRLTSSLEEQIGTLQLEEPTKETNKAD